MAKGKFLPPLSEAQAHAAVLAVEVAVQAGADWPLKEGGSARSAVNEAAAALGLPRSTFVSRLQVAYSRYGLAPNGIAPHMPEAKRKGKAKKAAVPPAEAPRLPAHDKEILSLKAKVKDLTGRLEAAHRDDMGSAALAEILAGLSAAPVEVPAWLQTLPDRTGKRSAHVPVAPWADWHAGETVSAEATRGKNEYSVEIMERRVERLLSTTIMLTREYGPGNYPGIVIPLAGDFVSGGIHPELKETDDLRLLPSILKVRDVLLGALIRMADVFGHVYCPAVCGNHGRMTHRPEFKGYEEKNADWAIYMLLIRALEDRGEKRVIIDFQPSNEAYFRIFSHRFLLVHGDMLGVKGGDGIIGSIGPIMRGKMKVGARMRSFGEDFDTLLMGHWHQELFLPGVIVANSLKGYDEYVMKALSAPFSLPSQPLFYVHPKIGITSYSTIRLEDGPAREPAPWVSFPGKSEAA